MLRITPVGVGAVEYLLQGSGCDREVDLDRDSEQRSPEEYYLRAAERGHAGRWLGAGAAEVGIDPQRAADPDQVRAVFGNLAHAQTGEQLGSAPRKFQTVEQRIEAARAAEPDASPERVAEIERKVRASQRQAVGYYDCTFSPAKSVSVYWALLKAAGRDEDAAKVEAVHAAAVDAAVAYLEREAGYARAGHHGKVAGGRSDGTYIDAHRFVATAWQHETSRANEPQLHTHVGILNRVLCDDGKWRALDGRSLYEERAMAAAIYEADIEEGLIAECGVQLEMRPDGKAREIVGISPELRDAYSSRRADIVAQVEAWAASFEERHGVEPSKYARTIMAERAALATREVKTHQSIDELQDGWSMVAENTAGQSIEATLAAIDGQVTSGAESIDRDAIIREAVAAVQSERATWSRADIGLALKHAMPVGHGLRGSEFDRFIGELADEAVRPGNVAGVLSVTAPEMLSVPDELRRADGRARWRAHRDERYATEDHLAAEQRIVVAAQERTAPAINAGQAVAVEAQLITEGLNDAQRSAVLGVMTSGRAGDVLIGPAGTGKSYTVGALNRHWPAAFDAPVLGITTAQTAADVLAEDGVNALNTTRFLHRYTHTSDQAGQRLRPGTLIVVDEASMSSTEQLSAVLAIAKRDGAKILYTGDDAQLSAVGAGGMLRLLSQELGAYELEDPRRFNHEWEAAATLRLRAGDAAVLDEYERRGRIVQGTKAEMEAAAMRDWMADTVAGYSSMLIVQRNEHAAELSRQLREQLIQLGRVDPGGVELMDGNRATAGDLIQTRRNDWQQRTTDGRPVINRDMWNVLAVEDDGRLRVAHADRGDETWLDADYLRRHAQLGYAGTAHAAQGATLSRSRDLFADPTDRAGVLVPMTRGRDLNVAYVVTQADASEGNAGERLQSDGRTVLAAALERDTSARSATEVLREEMAAAESLASLGGIWSHVVEAENRERCAAALRAELGEERAQQVVDAGGTEPLWRAMRTAELAGHEPEQLLHEVIAEREIDSARNVADVLRGRIAERATEARAATGVHGWTAYSWEDRTPRREGPVGDFSRELAREMDQRQSELGERQAREPEPWAIEHLGPVPDEPLERAQWTARAAQVAGYREMYGREQEPTALGPAPHEQVQPHERAAWNAAYDALARPEQAREYAAATDDELQAARERYDREELWAPPDVSEQLRAEHDARREAQALAAESQLLAEQPSRTAAERAELIERADVRRRLAERMAERAEQLEEVDRARKQWHEHTQPERRAAEQAREEQALRQRLAEATQRRGEPTSPAIDEGRHVEREQAIERDGQAVEPAQVDNGQQRVDAEPSHSSTREPTEWQTRRDGNAEAQRISNDELDRALTQAREAAERVAQREAEREAARERAAAEEQQRRHSADVAIQRAAEQEREQHDRGNDGPQITRL